MLQNLILSSVSFGGVMLGLQTWGFILDIEKPLVAAFLPHSKQKGLLSFPFFLLTAICQVW